MELLTPDQRTKLLANGEASAVEEHDHEPVVRLYLPGTRASWLLTELAQDDDIAVGLCDLGLGSPEVGSVPLSELRDLSVAARDKDGRVLAGIKLRVERDIAFRPEGKLSVYARRAYEVGRIVL